MLAERVRDAGAVPRWSRRTRLLVGAAVVLVVLALLLLSHRLGRAEPTGDYRPRLPPDALANGCYPLPAGVELDLPYQVRSDRDVRTAGELRRRLVGHYSLVDAEEARRRLVASFVAAGFREVDRHAQHASAGGRLEGVEDQVLLRRPGTGVVTVGVDPLPDTSADTLVRGRFLLDLPVVARASAGGWCDNPSSTKRWPEGLTPEEGS